MKVKLTSGQRDLGNVGDEIICESSVGCMLISRGCAIATEWDEPPDTPDSKKSTIRKPTKSTGDDD